MSRKASILFFLCIFALSGCKGTSDTALDKQVDSKLHKVETVLDAETSEIKRKKNTVKASGKILPDRFRERTIEISKDDVALAGNTDPSLLLAARVVPYFQSGQVVGLRLFAIQEDSPPFRWGFKNGDIVSHINDEPLEIDPSPHASSFSDLLNALKQQTKLDSVSGIAVRVLRPE